MNILQCQVVLALVFSFSHEISLESQCGIKVLSLPQNRISKGVEVEKNSWPWLANLMFKSIDEDKNGKFFCGATLISLKSVLTAAHCMQDKQSRKRLNPDEFEVQLGRHNLKDNYELKEFAKVFDPIIIIAMHPDWDPTNYSNLRYDADLALLIAKKDIEHSPHISPVCLSSKKNFNGNVVGTIVGWGYSSDEKLVAEDKPREAQVERVSQEDCFLENYELANISSKRTFCVKGVEEDSGPCRGDSGGGFFVKYENVWHIHGIVSSSMVEINCPRTKHSIFTKLSVFNGWIERGMKEFHTVPATYKHDDNLKDHHELRVAEVLRRGAFISTNGNFAETNVTSLWTNDQNLTFFPNNIGYLFPDLKQLLANSSHLKFIERMNFKNMEQLEDLQLKDNLIENIPFDTFYDLKKVEIIGISKNKLKIIHANTFTNNLQSLKKIDLSFNQIQSIGLQSLRNKNVEWLSLKHNNLESIPHDAFDEMENLETIDIGRNQLKSIHNDTFSKNPRMKKILADHNQFKSLPQMLFTYNKDLSIVYFNDSQIQITEMNCTFDRHGNYTDYYYCR